MPSDVFVSEIFDPTQWRPVEIQGTGALTDITYHRHVDPATGADRAPSGSPSTGPKSATPSGRTPSTSC